MSACNGRRAEGDILEIDTDAAVDHGKPGQRLVLVVSVDEPHSALGPAVERKAIEPSTFALRRLPPARAMVGTARH